MVSATVAELTAATEEQFNAIVDERIAMAMNTTVSAVKSELAMWIPVAKTPISPEKVSLENVTTYNYQIPDVIPLTAKEFMVYASVICGIAHLRTFGGIIFTCCTMA